MREALALSVAGAIAGVGLALAGGRLVAGFLHDLQPTDPVAVGAATTVMLDRDGNRLPARTPRRPVDTIQALRAE